MSKIKILIQVINEETGKVHIDELDENEEYFYLIEKAVQNNKDPIQAMNYMLCLGSRKLYDNNHIIATSDYIGK